MYVLSDQPLYRHFLAALVEKHVSYRMKRDRDTNYIEACCEYLGN